MIKKVITALAVLSLSTGAMAAKEDIFRTGSCGASFENKDDCKSIGIDMETGKIYQANNGTNVWNPNNTEEIGQFATVDKVDELISQDLDKRITELSNKYENVEVTVDNSTNNYLDYDALTDDQKAALKGQDGAAGRDGKDGVKQNAGAWDNGDVWSGTVDPETGENSYVVVGDDYVSASYVDEDGNVTTQTMRDTTRSDVEIDNIAKKYDNSVEVQKNKEAIDSIVQDDDQSHDTFAKNDYEDLGEVEVGNTTTDIDGFETTIGTRLNEDGTITQFKKIYDPETGETTVKEFEVDTVTEAELTVVQQTNKDARDKIVSDQKVVDAKQDKVFNEYKATQELIDKSQDTRLTAAEEELYATTARSKSNSQRLDKVEVEIAGIHNDINRLDGMMAANAAANAIILPSGFNGNLAIGVGVGSYRGHSGLSIGAVHDGGDYAVKVTVSGTDADDWNDLQYGASVNFTTNFFK